MNGASSIRFDRVSKAYSDGRRVVDEVSLDVERGTFVVLLGPSGCGKTTLLKTVNRLVAPTSGHVDVEGVDVATVDATTLRRGIGYVIQQIGLFPHMTVAQNVAVVPSLLAWQHDRIASRVAELLDLVRLPADEFGNRYPAALSGGQQQRVGIARALAADPAILLMDEPFGALDAIERSRLQRELAGMQRRLRKTVVFVTHDVDEALRLADTIVVMREGRVVQHDRPLAILAKPASDFVAELVDAGDLVRRFSAMKVRDALLEAGSSEPALTTLRADDDLRAALGAMLASGSLRAAVVDERGNAAGTLTLQGMLDAARAAAR
ncbi:MAG TPA: ABC transporter ATP-binding protein [Candidatus Acidoferrales bacterium]|nr:ABC transporter ATP-binding protein [Candidatus Acidoferrales bacterium]